MAHQAVLNWAAAADAGASSSYNIYRATSACPASGLGTLSFSKMANTTALTYTDATVVVGSSYCYYATQLAGSLESAPSNTAGGSVVPNTVTIQLVLA